MIQGRAGSHRALVVLGAFALAALVVPSARVAGSTPAAATSLGSTCATSGPQTQTGSNLISGPMLPQITGTSLPISTPADVTATSQINPHGIVTTTASLHLDLAAVASSILETRVKPGVVAAGYPTLAPTAWDVLDLDRLAVTFPLPSGTTAHGTPTASSSTSGASAAFGPDGVTLTVAHLVADTRTPAAAAIFTVSWEVADGGAPPPRELVLHPGAITYDAHVDVGLLFYGVPVVGGITGPWACTPDAPDAVLATTDVVSAPVSTASSTTAAPSTLPPTTAVSSSTTSTTWPSAPRTPPGSCAVSGFDRDGGYLGVDLGATGYFRTARYGGRWWLVTPEGHPFWSQGINHVAFDGTPDQYGVAAYRDAVTAKYGTKAAWAAAQVSRMRAWGYNTLGAWSDADLFGAREPYTLLLDLTNEDFGTGVMEDLWAPAWSNHVDAVMATVVAAHRDDPRLLGYWLDNELHWGPDWRQVHLLDEYLARPASAPGKQVLLAWLHTRYPTFAAFAADFTTDATDWASLAQPTHVTSWTATGGEATRAAWVGEVATRYFSYADTALRAADPHHLDLGPRMLAQTTGTPVLEVAARYVDVASFNDYTIVPELAGPLRHADPTYLSVDHGLAAQEAVLHKPILISEWSFRAADSGLPNTWPPLFPVLATQGQRAAAYESFVKSLLGTSWVVGQHWFEHADEPPAGRPGGEDSNFGLVNLHDDPYRQVVEISKTMHDCAYARLLSPATTTTGPAATSTVAGATTAPTVLPPASTPATAVAAEPTYTG